LRHDARVDTAALDVDFLARAQVRIHGLRHRNQHAARQANEDLLRRLGLVEIFLLSDVAADCADEGSCSYRNVSAGAGSNQAADAGTRKATDDSADALIVIAFDLGQVNLLDDACSDLGLGRPAATASRRSTRAKTERQHCRQKHLVSPVHRSSPGIQNRSEGCPAGRAAPPDTARLSVIRQD